MLVLTSGFATTSYLWDTRTVKDGDYVIKIVQADTEDLEVETIMEGPFKIKNSSDTDISIAPPEFYMALFALIVPVIIKKRRES